VSNTNNNEPVAGRQNDPEVTRENILEVATREFADKGLAGARIDEIAEKTHSSKRMIYYYFGSKDELYRAVLARAYAGIRESEATRNFEALPADEALRAHIEHTFDYHAQHPEFVRLVMNENIHRAEHLSHVEGIRDRNERVLASMRAILEKGMKAKLFREGLDPLDLHMSISALCFYNVSNRYTVSTIFGQDVGSKEMLERRRARITETILESVLRKTRD
jgi:AcrR family transcriptional regulator